MSSDTSPPTGAGKNFMLMILSTVLSLLVAEAVVRVADAGALPQLDCYELLESRGELQIGVPQIRLKGQCDRLLARPGGGTWRIQTNEMGLRGWSAEGAPWLLAGDSQVLGMNVDFPETWMGRVKERHRSWLGAGVPGHGVADALAHAEAVMRQISVQGVVVVVNAANDWAEARSPASSRYVVTGGWLLRPADASRWAGRFFGTPAAASHLLSYAVTLAGRDWKQNPALLRFRDSPYGLPQGNADEGAAAHQMAARQIALALHSFAAAHPSVPFRVLLLPVDFESSEARARAVLPPEFLTGSPWASDVYWEELLAMIPDLKIIDLRDAFPEPEDFLTGDYHLSPKGHAILADRLIEAVSP